MSLATYARELAANYRSQPTRDMAEDIEMTHKSDELLLIAYELEQKEKFDATVSPR